ncbi:hypothetical protein [Desulfuromonas thiophila]|uniref:hypothetical protein n=1 Tax=Desulfuromonas thiophila TaxID=57664 RepID=UPI0024A7D5B3|nr:hypothetical protein [Desulfuromonas thiophila]
MLFFARAIGSPPCENGRQGARIVRALFRLGLLPSRPWVGCAPALAFIGVSRRHKLRSAGGHRSPSILVCSLAARRPQPAKQNRQSGGSIPIWIVGKTGGRAGHAFFSGVVRKMTLFFALGPLSILDVSLDTILQDVAFARLFLRPSDY